MRQCLLLLILYEHFHQLIIIAYNLIQFFFDSLEYQDVHEREAIRAW